MDLDSQLALEIGRLRISLQDRVSEERGQRVVQVSINVGESATRSNNSTTSTSSSTTSPTPTSKASPPVRRPVAPPSPSFAARPRQAVSEASERWRGETPRAGPSALVLSLAGTIKAAGGLTGEARIRRAYEAGLEAGHNWRRGLFVEVQAPPLSLRNKIFCLLRARGPVWTRAHWKFERLLSEETAFAVITFHCPSQAESTAFFEGAGFPPGRVVSEY